MIATPTRLFVTGARGRLAHIVAEHRPPNIDEIILSSRTAHNGHPTNEALLKTTGFTQRDIVLHLAWSDYPSTAGLDFDAARSPDIRLLETLLHSLATKPDSARPHLVFFSSGGAVYGNASGRPSRETDPCHPVGGYGKAKRHAEKAIARYVQEHGITATILRVSNPYGHPGEIKRSQGLISHAIKCALNQTELTLWGDGSAQKDFIHCSDFLDALDQVLALRPPGLFNLGSGSSHTVSEVLRTIEAFTGAPLRYSTRPAAPWDVHDSRLDTTKLNTTIAWSPKLSLRDGIAKTMDACRQALKP